ncbi:YggS family pyridoxal phosphate-dependent enzyme [Petrotoga sp. 9PWA.NaAc.5.4]|uniref:YggS family pyridoxal phosphate-dependent enzyme n=1 Tax=Petrotoga sp. 9PWA.NaAc.5.4 TaxID=1434328 RepID=UPI000CC85B1F|nr:alanine racemase [Petrotoga sp. 9PWA.NaAc.5.4]
MNELIKENYKKLKEEIKEIALNCKRNYEEIKLVAVSKNFSAESIKSIYEEGQNDFGENRAQEMQSKHTTLENLDITWHFIGRIQTKKIKNIVNIAEYIHSVCRLKEIEEIQKRAETINKIQKIFLEVNVSGEETKAGLQPFQVEDFLNKVKNYKNIEVIGLMTMAPYTQDKNNIRKTFSTLRELRDSLSAKFPSLKELSMGMSNDYRIAIEEGSTFLRIGTKIFGERKIADN